MERARIAACAGLAVFVLSLEASAKPPHAKGKAHPGNTPFIEFPVPGKAVGVIEIPGHAMKQLKSQGFGKAQERGNSKVQLALPLTPGGFPTIEKTPVPVPECGAR